MIRSQPPSRCCPGLWATGVLFFISLVTTTDLLAQDRRPMEDPVAALQFFEDQGETHPLASHIRPCGPENPAASSLIRELVSRTWSDDQTLALGRLFSTIPRAECPDPSIDAWLVQNFRESVDGTGIRHWGFWYRPLTNRGGPMAAEFFSDLGADESLPTELREEALEALYLDLPPEERIDFYLERLLGGQLPVNYRLREPSHLISNYPELVLSRIDPSTLAALPSGPSARAFINRVSGLAGGGTVLARRALELLETTRRRVTDGPLAADLDHAIARVRGDLPG